MPPSYASSSTDASISASGEKRFPEYQQSPYRDWIFAVLFVGHLIGMFIVAGVYGPSMVSYISSQQSSGSNEKSLTIIGILVVSMVVSAAFSFVWLEVMKRFSDRIIHISIVTSCVLCALAAVLSFVYGAFLMAVVYLLVGLLQVWYYYAVRHRIPFAHATLYAASKAIQTSSGPMFVAVGLCLLNIGWLSFWSFTFAAVLHASNNSTNGFAIFFLLLSLFWTSMVLKNVGHVTTAGTVASFYFIPQSRNATANAFIRAVTTSFGSICFGSLIVSFIHTLRTMLQMFRRRENNFAREILDAIADCILGLIERAVAYFNHYAYTQIAIYGYDFITASKRTWELMQQKLFTMIINDDLTSWALLTGVFLGGVCGGMISAVWSAILAFDGWVGVTVLGFLLGCAIAALFMTVLDSAITTSFVVWAEDPHTMSQNQPDCFWRMAKAAEPLYGVDPRMQQMQQI